MSEKFLHIALQEAFKGRGFCAPNPAVGAVVVKDDKILGKGFHSGFGQPHAEVMALSSLANTENATLYVTLEPCCHWGKTPPCTDLIIQKKIAKVIYGYTDTNPAVLGKSAALLKKLGIAVELVELPEIKRFYQSYTYWQQSKKPFVTAKIALSLDGKIAGENGKPIQITDVPLKGYTHRQRLYADALLTTVRTILQDNPAMNVRLDSTTIAKPIFILDRNLQLPLSAKIIQTTKSLTLFYDNKISQQRILPYEKKDIKCIPISVNSHLLDIHDVFQIMGELGIHDLWIEAGGRLTEFLIKQKLLQQLLIYIAPKTLGSNALSAFKTNFDFSDAKTIQWSSSGNDVQCEIIW